MAAWVETSTENFTARYDEADEGDARDVLSQLEATRERLRGLFSALPGEVSVILHSSRTEVDIAQPFLPLARAMTTSTARRYLAGWAGRDTVHTLAPRHLAELASNVEGSREMLALTPAALYVQLVIAACNPDLPPPWSPRNTLRAARWAWLAAGAAQWFSGQTSLAGPVIARRLREDARPGFPPRLRDAALLGGSVIDLLDCEQGTDAAVELACARLQSGDPRRALVKAFDDRALMRTEGAWRAHLAHMAWR